MAVSWDAADFFFPDAYFLSTNLHNHTMPLFNPYILCGFPKIGDPQSMYLLPTQILLCRLFTIDTLSKFTVLILFYLYCGSCYLYALLRRQGLALAPALLGVLVFMLGGPIMSRMQHSCMIVSYSFIPGVLFHYYAALHATRRPILHYLAGSFFFYGLLVNINHISYLAVLLIVAICGHEIWFKRQGWLANSAKLGLAWLLTGLVAAVALIPVFFVTADGSRGDFSYATLIGGMNPVYLVTWFVPNLLGTNHGVATAQLSTTLAIPMDSGDSYLYIGIIPILLIVFALLAYRKDRRFLLLTGMLALTLIYAFGEQTDLYKLIFDYLPGAKMFRRSSDAIFIIAFLMSLLAALSAQMMIEKRRLKNINWNSLVVLIFLGGLIVLSFVIRARYFNTQYKHLFNQVFLHGLFITAVVLLLISRQIEKRWVWGLLVLATLCDLRYNNVANRLNGHKDKLMPEADSVSNFLSEQLALNQGRVEYFDPWGVGAQCEAIGNQVEEIEGYNPLKLLFYKQYIAADRQSDPKAPLLMRDRELANSLGIRYVTSPVELACKKMLAKKIGSIFIYRNDQAKPRLVFAENGQETSGTLNSSFHTNGFTAMPNGKVKGQVVAHYLFCKGWFATVDGAVRPVHPYQDRFLAVNVNLGDKKVVFSYNPWRYACYWLNSSFRNG